MTKSPSISGCFFCFSRQFLSGFVVVLMILAQATGALAQAPNISYTTPISYYRNSAISSLSPTNSGGAVPSQLYGNTTTYAGTATSGGSNASTAITSTFNGMKSAVLDRHGNMYVAEFTDGRIRKISASGGAVTTLVDWSSFQPQALEINSATGDLYISIGTHRILKVPNANSANYLTQAPVYSDWSDGTIVWLGTNGTGTTDASGTSARFNTPLGLCVDASNTFMYIADYGNDKIRKVNLSNGAVSTVATSGVTIADPEDVVVDASGVLFVTSASANVVYRIGTDGVVTNFASSGTAGFADGTAATVRFGDPRGIDMDASGNLYVADGGAYAIRKITTSGDVSTLAGSGSGVGNTTTDGVGSIARFDLPWDIIVDGANSVLYVPDFDAYRIRKVEYQGFTIAPALPAGLTINSSGVISGTPTTATAAADYVVTAYNSNGSSSFTLNIAIVEPPTITTTTATSITGSGASAGGNVTSEGGSAVTAKGVVWSTSALPTVALATITTDGSGSGSFSSTITGLSPNTTYYYRAYATTNAGTVYGSQQTFTTLQIAPSISYPSTSYTLLRNTAMTHIAITNAGGTPDKAQVSTLAGGSYGFANGIGASAKFGFPWGVWADGLGSLFVTDQVNHRIRKIDLTSGEVSTLAGENSGFADGIGAAARFLTPTGITGDDAGNLYISDRLNQRILKGMRDRYVQARLKDNVLKRQIEINMNAPTDYDFIGTGSAAWDSTRFEIVYVEAGRPSTGVTLEPEDAAEQPSVKLYPNPSKAADLKLSLRAMAPGIYSVHVLDMTGRLVATSRLDHRSVNGEYRILEGRHLSPGTYIIKLSDQNKQPKETLRLLVD